MGKKGETYFNNMSVFALGRSILLVHIRAGNMVRYAYSLKEDI
jgi:hypothetical protein